MGNDIAFVFDSNYTMEKFNVKVKDGKVVIKDKEFFVDKARPITMKGGIKTKNAYFFKWNVLHAVGWKVNENNGEYLDLSGGDGEVVKELVPFQIEFGEGEGNLTPEMVKSTVDMRFLKNMKSYAGGKGKGLNVENKGIFLVVIFIIVFAIVFLSSYYYLGGFG